MIVPDFFLAGFQKCATTWMWQCMSEHPGLQVPKVDAVHFFTIHYHRGFDWYQSKFPDLVKGKPIGDTTPQYAKHMLARKRIFECNADAKIILSMRAPIERGLSHYRHEFRKGVTTRPFSRCLENNVDVFEAWVGTGFYDVHIQELLKLFPAENLHYILHDDILANPEAVLARVFRFLGVDDSFQPPSTRQWINRSAYQKQPNWWQRFRRHPAEEQNECPAALRGELLEIYEPHISWLEKFLDRDLSHWKA
jgi:hypothetical protein